MRSMTDSAFDDVYGVDILEDFEAGWRELDAAETSEEANETDRDSVWLECDGELIDAASVKLIGVRESARGFKTLLFTCPRCNETHESIRFR
jgi:hypothetical protein